MWATMIRKSQFQKLAKSLIGPGGTFSDFLQDCVLSKAGAFNYETQEAVRQTKIIKMVETSLVESAKEGFEKQTYDIELIGLYSDITFQPSVDDTTFTFNNVNYKFKAIVIDPAKATITLRGVL